MTPQLSRLMYASISAEPVPSASLDAIFAVSRRNNLRDGITGVLMADGRMFIQFLEGPHDALQTLWQKISADSRHHFVVRLYEHKQASKRLFGEWSMLKGEASRAEMLALVKGAYQTAGGADSPEWAGAIGPLMILLDGDFSRVYAQALKR